MVYTVTLNPSIDMVVDLDGFEIGKTNRVVKETCFPGGKGINVSKNLTNLEIDNCALGFVAGETGARIKRLLSQMGIAERFVKLADGESRINIKLRNVKNTEINGMGAKASAGEIAMLKQKIMDLSVGDILVLAGGVPAGMDSGIYAELMAVARKNDVQVVLDTSGEALKKGLAYDPFLIKPNKQELADFFGTEIRDENDAIFFGEKLKEMGAQNVVISMGGAGAVLLDMIGGITYVKAPLCEVVNVSGAGDALISGLLARYIETGDWEDAIKFGVAAGTACAACMDSPRREDIYAVYASME